jgi:hypothetical protein
MKKQDFSIEEGTFIKVKYGKKEKSGYYFITRGLWKLFGNFELRSNINDSFNSTSVLRFKKVNSFEIIEKDFGDEVKSEEKEDEN